MTQLFNPVKVGASPDKGFWARYFGRTIKEVSSAHLFNLEDRLIYIAPVQYMDGSYGLVTHNGEELSPIRPNTLIARAAITESVRMPQILANFGSDAIEISTEVDELHPETKEYRPWLSTEVFLVTIYGVLGPRNGRNDTVVSCPVRIPPIYARKW